MKRVPYEYAEDHSGKQWWRSLDELAGSPEVQARLAAELPPGASEPPDGVSRRDFFTTMGASFALAGVVGCRRPVEHIVPFARAPEEMVLGRPLFYATAVPFMGTAAGLLVETHEGRPTKIEGNPRHPDSHGKSSAWTQAMILDLYDPDRSTAPIEQGEARSWDDASAALAALGKQLKATQGQGLAVLTEAHRSPTTAAALAELKRQLPQARIVRYEPFSRENARLGTRIAFGKVVDTVVDLAKAQVIVTLDADPMATEGSTVKHARGWAEGRKLDTGREMARLYSVESRMSVTGANADHRLRMRSADVAYFVVAVARELQVAHGVDCGASLDKVMGETPLGDRALAYVKAIGADLARNRGRGLLLAGERQPPVVHALVHAMNLALGNIGNDKPVTHVRPFDEASEGPAGIKELADAILKDQVTTLVVLGANPAFNAPGDALFTEAVQRPGLTLIHVGTHVDETGLLATWHVNRAHALESWGDVRAEDGTLSIQQPLIAPLFDGRTDAEVIHLLLGQKKSAYDLVREVWRQNASAGDFDRLWRRWLHDGVAESSQAVPEGVSLNAQSLTGALGAIRKLDGLEVTFQPDPHAFDGRLANIGWLQEWPDPMTKLAWGSAVLVSQKTARALGVGDGASLKVQLKDAAAGWMTATLPVLIAPGQADDSLAVTVGQGRRVGRVAKGVGVDVVGLRLSSGFGFAAAVASSVGGHDKLARTQEHWSVEGRPIVREATFAEYKENPTFVHKAEVLTAAQMVGKHKPLSLYPEWKHEGHRWGMTIDLGSCTGCGGCMVACQSENSVPIVGRTELMRSREMHWLRVDRYFEGSDSDEATSISQPMMCQQCENAPCEQVCPVAATTHSPEGLNDMAYNRCVGTRYCANNCPWKVRRFNFFHYNKAQPELRKLAFNPDVTVRSRGVMEKCTWCVQRINAAKIEGHRNGTDIIADGTIKTACEEACPTSAIVFGDLADPKSRVSRLQNDDRAYKTLEELNTRPRLSYLARIRNPNPELA